MDRLPELIVELKVTGDNGVLRGGRQVLQKRPSRVGLWN